MVNAIETSVARKLKTMRQHTVGRNDVRLLLREWVRYQ